MKSKLILTAVAASMLAFTACNKKVDDKNMADIKQFDTDWTALGTTATNWSNDLTAEKQKTTDHLTKQTAMMATMGDKIKDEQTKAKMNELDRNDHEAVTAMETMTNQWNDFNTQWTANTTAWTDWKAKVDKGEVSNDDATKAMTDWHAKYNDAKTKIDTWQTAYNTVKDNCEKNMAECDHMSASMTTADASTSTTTTGTTTTNTNGNGTTGTSTTKTKTTKTTKTTTK